MKKIIFACFAFFILLFKVNAVSTADYTLEIKEDGTFIENIEVFVDDYERRPNSADPYAELLFLDSPATVQNDYYNKTVTQNGNDYTASLNYTYNEYKFSKSTVLNTCFENKDFEIGIDGYEFDLTGYFMCGLAPVTNVKVITDLNVTSTNGTRNGNVYSWSLNENSNVSIRMNISKPQEEESPIIDDDPVVDDNPTVDEGSNTTFIIAIVVLGVVILGIIGFLIYKYFKNMANNRI